MSLVSFVHLKLLLRCLVKFFSIVVIKLVYNLQPILFSFLSILLKELGKVLK